MKTEQIQPFPLHDSPCLVSHQYPKELSFVISQHQYSVSCCIPSVF